MKGIKYWDTKKEKHVLAYHIEENGYAYNKKKTLLIGVVGLDLIESDGFFSQIKKDAGSIDADNVMAASKKYAFDIWGAVRTNVEDFAQTRKGQRSIEDFKAGVEWYKQNQNQKLKDRINSMADTHDEIQDNG